MKLTIINTFAPTFLLASLAPGMSMAFALKAGISLGYKRALSLMIGELVGISLVSIASLIFVIEVMQNLPVLHISLKVLASAYLVYLGLGMCIRRTCTRSAKDMALLSSKGSTFLIYQGAKFSLINAKTWGLMLALLPAFIDKQQGVIPQAWLLVSVILACEFVCLSLYACGGSSLHQLLSQKKNVILLNRIAGAVLALIGLNLFFD